MLLCHWIKRVNLILELNISIPLREGKNDNKIYEVESFLPVCYCTICIAIDTFFSGGFADIGCIDMNLRKANCNNDMVLIKMWI